MTLELFNSHLLDPVPHGFFTRKGGASSGIFEGLNCGPGSSDQAEVVDMNRDRVAERLGAASSQLLTLHQVHSADVITVTTPFTDRPRADAMVTDQPGIVLGVLTADCMPVLFSDPSAGVIGAAHAGWRGAMTGVLEATRDAMEALGADRSNIRAVIGPCISQQAYEVGPEFMAEFLANDPESTQFFKPGTGDRLMFDLPAFGLHRLHSMGLAEAEWLGHCTYADAERFFSYRRSVHRSEADYGRLISAIRL